MDYNCIYLFINIDIYMKDQFIKMMWSLLLLKLILINYAQVGIGNFS